MRELDQCVHDISLPRAEAVSGMLSRCDFQPVTEHLPAEKAYGRVLAMDMVSNNTLPNFLASNRDGVAVYYDRFASGMPDTAGWREGADFVFSNTGIGIDGDFDTVILIEQVRFDEDGCIRFVRLPEKRGENTVPVGTELRAGAPLCYAGQTLTPTLSALLAKGGHTVLPVVKRPVVAFLPTGNELVPPDQPLPLRKNVDANSTLVRGKLLEFGAEPLIYPISKDDPAVLRARLLDAAKKADIVLLNAGSSKGTDDFSHKVLDEIGQVYNQQVDTGPGKHTAYGRIGNTPVVGLSGPTTCCDYTMEWYVLPLIDRFLGRPVTVFPKVRARIGAEIAMGKKGVTFMLGCRLLLDEAGTLTAIPAANLPDMGRLERKVNCFLPLTEGFTAQAGDSVEVELRWPFLAPVYEPGTLAMASHRPFAF